jgi:hypothetical protein
MGGEHEFASLLLADLNVVQGMKIVSMEGVEER